MGTAFVYQGSLYMISSTKRLYFIKRKGFELIRDLSVYDLNRKYSRDYASFYQGILMVDSDELIFCSRLFLVGCRITKNLFDNVEEFRYPNMSYWEIPILFSFRTIKVIDQNSIGFSNKSILINDDNKSSIFSRKNHNWIERKISNSKNGEIVTLKNFTDESDLVLLLARDQSCAIRPFKDLESIPYGIYKGCMKFDIYSLRETDGILKWEEMGIFGKPNNDEGTLFFPKIIRPTKNGIFPFGPEIHFINDRYDYQNGSQILFENWTKNISREIDDNFPLTVTNRMTLLRILQI